MPGASARAIEMRWRWPPDSERSPEVACRSVMPTDLSRSSASLRELALRLALLHWWTASSTAPSSGMLAWVERAVRILEDHLDLPPIGRHESPVRMLPGDRRRRRSGS